MSTVVFLSHAGVRCAVPASQVLGIGRREEVTHLVRLWPEAGDGSQTDRRSSQPQPRHVSLRTPDGPRALPCAWARFVDVPPTALLELPALLDREIALPFVVGLAEIEAELVWLIDMSFAEPGWFGRSDPQKTEATK